jgi:hypothetical protein
MPGYFPLQELEMNKPNGGSCRVTGAATAATAPPTPVCSDMQPLSSIFAILLLEKHTAGPNRTGATMKLYD